MRLAKIRHRLGKVLKSFSADPGQVRYLPRWRRHFRRTTMEMRTPWLPYRVIDRLAQELPRGSRVFEYGGGGSTLWFLDQGLDVVTVEHHPEWTEVIAEAVRGRDGVTVRHASDAEDYAEYVAAIDEYPDESFDAVIVDGRERVRCLERAVPKVKRGGLLVLDDSDRERYQPAFEMVRTWDRKTYEGLRPSRPVTGVTTVWKRP